MGFIRIVSFCFYGAGAVFLSTNVISFSPGVTLLGVILLAAGYALHEPRKRAEL
jgi:hypothetical protein